MKHELTKLGARRIEKLLSDPEWPQHHHDDSAPFRSSGFHKVWREIAVQILLTGQPHYVRWINNNMLGVTTEPDKYYPHRDDYPKCRLYDYVLLPCANRAAGSCLLGPNKESTIAFRRSQ